jgi:hypothetical protein
MIGLAASSRRWSTRSKDSGSSKGALITLRNEVSRRVSLTGLNRTPCSVRCLRPKPMGTMHHCFRPSATKGRRHHPIQTSGSWPAFQLNSRVWPTLFRCLEKGDQGKLDYARPAQRQVILSTARANQPTRSVLTDVCICCLRRPVIYNRQNSASVWANAWGACDGNTIREAV